VQIVGRVFQFKSVI